MSSKILKRAFTFDDLLLLPSASEILPSEVSTQTELTQNISLNMPLVSAAMDTVTTHKMAIAMARDGGIGIIHKNMTITEQAEEVANVKRFESGVIKEPYTLTLDESISSVVDKKELYGIGGFPVVYERKIVGILTNRDIRFETDMTKKVRDLMTPQDKLITAKPNISIEDAKQLLHAHKIEKLLLMNERGELAGMITVKDILKKISYPLAATDDAGCLLVGAAIGVNGDFMERATELIKNSVDVLVIDTAHGHHSNILHAIRKIKSKYEIEIIAGNIATAAAARHLIDEGVNGLKVGIGPGSICTTRVVTGVGVPQLSAIMDVVEVSQKHNVPIIADGGINYSGDIVKAIAAGAHTVMLGSLLAGTDESPGEQILFDGRRFKSYRGMGSIAAMQSGSKDRYFQESSHDHSKLVAEGIEGMVPYKGPIRDTLHQLIGGLKAGMGYCGTPDIESLRKESKFVEVTAAGVKESHPHDVHITKEAPNYHKGY